MADNVIADAGSGGATFATDDIGGVHYPRSKLVWGADGTATDASAAAPLPVVQTGALPAGTAAIGKLAANSGVDIGDVDVLSLPTLPTGSNTIGAVNLGQYTPASGRLPIELDAAALAALETITVASVTAPLPAGTNNIGDVDVVSLPTLPAGTNNIGDVDIASIAAGTNNIGDVDVLSLPALPAGTNNIGDVDVLSLPAIPAGSNNIGDVDVLSLPALPAGTNNIGDVDVLTLPALPAGTNNIGDVDIASIAAGDNNIGNVDVVTLPALPAGTNNIGDVDVLTLPAIPAGANDIGNVGIAPRTSGGLTISQVISAATTNASSAKASAGQVYGWYLSNMNAAVRYLKLYNKASAPTVGTDTPVMTVAIPGNTAGAGANVEFANGIAFGTGIAYALTTGVADADTAAVAANEIVVNLLFK